MLTRAGLQIACLVLAIAGEAAPQLTRGPYLQLGTPVSMVVRWRTDLPTDTQVLYGTNLAALDGSNSAAAFTTEHEVSLTGLTPGLTYFYSVGSSTNVLAAASAGQYFVASSRTGTGERTRIWVLGDAGTPGTFDPVEIAQQTATRDAYYALMGTNHTDLWLLLGDNAYASGTDLEYQSSLFNMYPTLLRNSVVWPTLGNHDTAQSTVFSTNYPYFAIFTLPTAGEGGGAPSGTEHYYSFNCANIHFVCLDAMTADRSATGAMALWLQADLQANTNEWVIAFWHHPPYSKGSHDSDATLEMYEMRQNLVPILEAYGADLVLTGHSHSYERSFLLNGHYGPSWTLTPAMILNAGTGREEETGAYRKPRGARIPNSGTVYAVAGCSGHIEGGPLNHPAMCVSSNVLGSVFLEVSSNRLDAIFLRETGATNDHFTILKQNFPIPVGTKSVLTYHNDNARTGQNTNETTLTLANVSTNTFGLVATRTVDDEIFAQPLVMTGVNVPGNGMHSLVFVATVNDSIYAFDADDPSVSAPYWQTNFLGPNVAAVRNTDMVGACGPNPGDYTDFLGNMGIVGTPVIDGNSRTLYVVARTRENGTNYVQRLHALDAGTGQERSNSPVVITATFPGTGEGSVGGMLTFEPQKHNQRAGLALVNGVVYVSWASHCDWYPYHGWIIGYGATNLQRVAVYNLSPNGEQAGVWQGGGAPAADAEGNLYVETGNGTWDTTSTNNAKNDFGDSVLKLSTTNGLAVADYFTPYNQSFLATNDLDLGSCGALVLPDETGSPAHPRLAVACGKWPVIYLLDRDNLGHFHLGDDSQIVQTLFGPLASVFGLPAYFNRTLYYASVFDRLKALSISNAVISSSILSQSSIVLPFPGATPSVSANGTSDGIVWVLQNNGWASRNPAILRAYNATNLALELYNSGQAGTRDQAPGAVKFTVPTIANGKVFVGGQGALGIYANANFINTPTIAPNGGAFTNSIMVTLDDATPGVSLFYTLDGTTPTTGSHLYTAPFTITASAQLKVRAFKAGSVDSQVASASFFNDVLIGTGTGLTGSYYADQFETLNDPPALTRIDPNIDFDWGSSPPDPSVSIAGGFGARWVGEVQVQFSEMYTFYTLADTEARLWVNDVLLVDQFHNYLGAAEFSSNITLTAGYRYSIRMEYSESTDHAIAKLSWSSPSTTKAAIPQSQLYPLPNLPPSVAVVAPADGANYQADSASVQVTALATDTDGSIAQIDFFAGATLLATLTNAPYTFTWSQAPPGSHTLFARARDDGGLMATSAPVSLTVTTNTGAPYGLTNRQPANAFLKMPSGAGGPMPPLLSQSGAFTNTPLLASAPGLIPYDVIVPLWSDGALKTRWLSVPNDGAPFTPGEQIGFATNGEWSFPAGTVFVKHFELVTNETNPNFKRRLETRLLVRDTNNGVYGVTYKWRPDNSDADLLSSSLSEAIPIVTATGMRTQTWYYPSPLDCLVCHTPVSGYVLGVKTRQLNRDVTYSGTGQTDNQLRTLNQLGLFNPPIANESSITNFIKLAGTGNTSATLEDRARSYLDANCAQCHRPGGASHSGFDARYDTPLASQNIVNAAPVNDLGLDGARVVAPEDIWRSVLYQRASSSVGATKMPPLARNLVDTNAMSVLADWVNSLPGTPALAPPTISPAGGTYPGPFSLTLQHPDPGAELRYTLDSTQPTNSSPLFSTPFMITNDLTVKAAAFEAGFVRSVTASAVYSIHRTISFTNAAYFNNGQFVLPLSGLAGKTYLLQGSTNLMNWITINTNFATTNLVNLIDPGASNFPYRFYRALEL